MPYAADMRRAYIYIMGVNIDSKSRNITEWKTVNLVGGKNMPELSLFFGIRITMYYEDHQPPHFHAEYNGQKVLVDITKGRVIRGIFPARQLKLVLAWCEIHRDELMQNWELAKDNLPLNKIAPLM